MSGIFQDQLLEQAAGMTATGIKAARLKEMPIPTPPLAEQHRIVTKVNELLALCGALKARLQDARITQVRFADAVVDQTVA